ncbi:MAG: hypothetical protein KA010_02730 [Saprospiraceae bacterium]|nr:hypothetical protein [Saprospiraceae bacterium]
MRNETVKKSLADLRKDLQLIRQADMLKIIGGKSKTFHSWNSGCTTIVPQ